MKTARAIRKAICMALLALLSAAHTAAMPPQGITTYSLIKQYPTRAGTKVLVRSTDDNAYSVTCGYASDNRSFFIVKNSNSSKSFYTSSPVNHVVPIINNYGFEIYDMVISGTTCWFCGSYWYETGETGQTIFGEIYWEVEHLGFVGRFDVEEAMSGSGTFHTVIVDTSYELTHIATNDTTVMVLGNRYDGYEQFVAEIDLPTSGQSGITKMTPLFESEVFMDVDHAGSKYVILSRFGNPERFYYYTYRFGLRYITPGRLINNDTMYVYDTWQLFYVDGWFTGVDPIHLSATHSGDGVVVSYVENNRREPNNAYNGHLFNIRINGKGSSTMYGFRSTDTARYTEIETDPESMEMTDEVDHKITVQIKRPVNSYTYTSSTAYRTSKCDN